MLTHHFSAFWHSERCRLLGFRAYLALLTMLIYAILINNIYPTLPRIIPLVLLVFPLLFPLRGLLKQQRYTYLWSSYLALFYLLFSVDIYMGYQETALAISSAFLIFIWFGTTYRYLKLTAKPKIKKNRSHN